MTAMPGQTIKRRAEGRCVSCAVPLEPDERAADVAGTGQCAECLAINAEKTRAAFGLTSKPAPRPAPVPNALAANLQARGKLASAAPFRKPISPAPAQVPSAPAPTCGLCALESGAAIGTNGVAGTRPRTHAPDCPKSTALAPLAPVAPVAVPAPVRELSPLERVLSVPRVAVPFKPNDTSAREKLSALRFAHEQVTSRAIPNDEKPHTMAELAKAWLALEPGQRRFALLDLD